MPVVAEQLRAAIARGEFQPGKRLVQEDLAASLGVSREPIRQALRLLQAEGLVVQRARRGVVVAPLTEEVVRDVYDVRAALDGLAARRAAERLPPETLDVPRTVLATARQHLDSGDVADLVAADRAFHTSLCEASGNQFASDMLHAVWTRVSVVMQAVLESGYAERAWREHAAILEAVAAADPDKAEQLARLHAWGAADMLGPHLRSVEQD